MPSTWRPSRTLRQSDPSSNSSSELAGIQAGPSTPEGVYARSVDGRTLYVNTTEEKKTVPLEGSKRGILTNRIYEGAIDLDPLASDLVQ